jgi:saccharopine dehydrogenase-like NADP-dependent oxidoreductase
MGKALLLGAGLVSRPLVRYLLDHGVQVTIASRTKSKADRLLDGHKLGKAEAWTVDDLGRLEALVADHDLAISLLPATMHTVVAQTCIKHRRHMVTTSYVSKEMNDLDEAARKADVLLINELGVDPGIDHMSAMKIVHAVQNNGGRVASFRSYCGGIPAPESNDNPWGYKFSWSPMAVLRAGTNAALYLKNGAPVEIAPRYLFMDVHHLDIEGVGRLESYPNRDSMSYISLYGLEGIDTMFRGTLRYPGWSDTLRRVGELGLLDLSERGGLGNKTWPELLAELIGAPDTNRIKERVAARLWLPVDAPTIQKLDWLGLFSPAAKLGKDKASVAELLSMVMQDRMMYAEGEKDMIVMHHDFVADYGSRMERITSSLVDFGIPGGDSSMARTVSLPAAIATRMVLDGTITDRGVHIPVKPEIYNPILDELATLDISLKERTFQL